MSHSRIPMISGDEVTALTGERKHVNWRAGQRKAVKRGINRRARRQAKVDLRWTA